MHLKSEVSGKIWYELKDVIKIAQGFGKEGNFTVLPNDIVNDIVSEMERLTELQEQAIENGLDLVSILEAAETEDCGCATCIKITTMVLKEKGLGK